MKFNTHGNIVGTHAVLSPSYHHWLGYDDDKLFTYFSNYKARQRGTELHAFASNAINLKIKLPRSKKTLNMYVNDAIGYKLDTEVPLFYSRFIYGTADSIGFSGNKLRIHDLKTGTVKGNMSQLNIYAGLFCLEYDHSPFDIDMELRIYQNNEIDVHIPESEEIQAIMDKITHFDKVLEAINV